jgi:hypothetical protein
MRKELVVTFHPNMKMYFNAVGFEDMDWIGLAQDREQSSDDGNTSGSVTVNF